MLGSVTETPNLAPARPRPLLRQTRQWIRTYLGNQQNGGGGLLALHLHMLSVSFSLCLSDPLPAFSCPDLLTDDKRRIATTQSLLNDDLALATTIPYCA